MDIEYSYNRLQFSGIERRLLLYALTGLLDPHELSLVNKEFDTLEEQNLLPVILEDVRARTPDLQSIETSSRDKV